MFSSLVPDNMFIRIVQLVVTGYEADKLIKIRRHQEFS